MKTIYVEYKSSDFSEAPDELENVATTYEINKIKDVVNALWAVKSKVFSVNVDVQLFALKTNDWRWDVSYVTVYLPSSGKTGDVKLFQYLQSKYDAADSIESEGFTLKELEDFLKNK